MKHLRKVMALVLAALVALVAATPAWAAGEGKITIKSSENGTTYDFYKLLDLTGKDTSNPADNKYDAVTYTLDSDWAAFFNGDGAAYLVATNDATANNGKGLNQINVNGTVKYLNITESNVVAFTNAAMNYAITNNVAADKSTTGTGSDLEVSGLDLGYYLMIPVDASKKTAASSGSVASLTSTVPEAEIQVKAVKPSIEKTDDKVSADIGEVVTYTLTGVVPNTSGYETYKYVIKDEMTSGLTFNKDVTIKVTHGSTEVTINTSGDGANATLDYTTKTNAFSADINVKELQQYVGDTITLTYTATVNDNAVTSSQEKNKATLDYGHNPNNLESTTPIEEEVYTAKVTINKFTGDATTGDKLADAKFALMNSQGKYYKYTAASGTTPAKVEWVDVSGAPTSGTAAVTDAMAQALADNETSYTPKTTNASGAAEFPGIKDGTYYLVEYAAPAGYNRLATPQAVTVQGNDVDNTTNHLENTAYAGQTVFDSAVSPTSDVQNQAGTELPSTGGMGTRILYTIGGAMIVAGGIYLVAKRRLSAME